MYNSKELKQKYAQYLQSANTSDSKLFFKQHTKNIDTTLYQIFLNIKNSQQNFSKNSFISFIALGSYARVELCLKSDIDIMIAYKNSIHFDIKPTIEKFVALAWDCGLKLGLRVVDIDNFEELETLANSDITVKTSILESRYIFGSKKIFSQVEKFLSTLRESNKKEFIYEQITRHEQRLLKYPLNMQVNLKDGYGGIREANILFWILNVLFDKKAKNLVGSKFNQSEYKRFTTALDFIFQSRNALHTINKKKVDTLTFDTLPQVSKSLGFKNEFEYMSKLFASLHIVHNFHSNMSSKFVRATFFEKDNLKLLRQNHLFGKLFVLNDKLYCSFYRKRVSLSKLIKEIIQIPNSIQAFDRSYVYFASRCKVPKSLSKNMKKDLKQLLFKDNLYAILKLFYNSELINFLIPNFKKISNLAQFDGYHKHPVDIHSLQTLKYVSNIKNSEVQDIFNNLSSSDKVLTRLVALFHDIGKGRKKDHHIVGENIFKKIMKHFGFDEEFIKKGATIIKYHDQMSRTALNEDIYSQKAILNFIGKFKSLNEIQILYVLTYCDICAVNDTLYSSSTAILMSDLYKKSSFAFENPELLKESVTRVSKLNSMQNLPQFQALPNFLKRKISQISSNQIFLRLKSKEILDIAINALDVKDYKFDIFNEDFLKIRIMKKKPLNLAYLLGKLQYLNMNSMNIYKLYDEKKDFEITFSKVVQEEELYLIEEIIHDSFDMSKSVTLKKPFIKRKEIFIDCNHTEDLALMKIITKDQKGLFAYIAKVFDDFGIEVESAKLTTSKTLAKDLLLIEKNGNFCKNKEKILDLICS